MAGACQYLVAAEKYYKYILGFGGSECSQQIPCLRCWSGIPIYKAPNIYPYILYMVIYNIFYVYLTLYYKVYIAVEPYIGDANNTLMHHGAYIHGP